MHSEMNEANIAPRVALIIKGMKVLIGSHVADIGCKATQMSNHHQGAGLVSRASGESPGPGAATHGLVHEERAGGGGSNQ